MRQTKIPIKQVVSDTPLGYALFETGMHRTLTQTYMDDFYGADLIWGPQPEIVKSFRLSYKLSDEDEFTNLIDETNNYQRRRAYTFQTITLTSLYSSIAETWGIDHGRVCEIRCYKI